MLESVARSPVSFFDKNPIGRVLNRFSNDIGVMDRQLNLNFLELSEQTFYNMALMVASWVIHPILLIPGISFVIACFLYLNYCKAIITGTKKLELVSRSPVYSHFSTTLYGLIPIRTLR
mmetsp:Transcript_14397/g.12224  ORF Transcript_14397/g.12224 Transcript_14397/m.12224 type:complete len:119 (+) Transcript_14397:2373-2729(+)